MSCEPDTATLLRSVGQKVTPQRMLILGALRHCEHHLSAYAILDVVRKTYPYVDLSTIYRTMQAAKELGLVVEVNLAGGDTEYEWVAETDHYHLVCHKCGAESVVEGDQLELLVGSIEKQHGFKANLQHMAIEGICKACSEAAPVS